MKKRNNILFIMTKLIILTVAFLDWLPTEQEWLNGLEKIDNSFPNTIWIDKRKTLKFCVWVLDYIFLREEMIL
ncbi:hypothetical protein [Macrococcus animalis]|uniref:hypothetical protein n=1 Tax=Macrococcus animalis TaxID=3395467 RepID=UPI0039BDE0A3